MGVRIIAGSDMAWRSLVYYALSRLRVAVSLPLAIHIAQGYGFIVTFRGRWFSSLKNPQTEQIEPRSTVAAALNQLQPIDVAFDWTGTVR